MKNKLDSNNDSNEKWYMKLLGDQKINVQKKAKFLTKLFLTDNKKYEIYTNFVVKKQTNFKIAKKRD